MLKVLTVTLILISQVIWIEAQGAQISGVTSGRKTVIQSGNYVDNNLQPGYGNNGYNQNVARAQNNQNVAYAQNNQNVAYAQNNQNAAYAQNGYNQNAGYPQNNGGATISGVTSGRKTAIQSANTRYV